MDFATAFVTMSQGYRVGRKHWTGYWYIQGNDIIVHYGNGGRDHKLRDCPDMVRSLKNVVCNDWEIKQ
jgi:hypothetical protein